MTAITGAVHPWPPSYFRRDGEAFIPGKLSRSPWMDDAVAGGPAAGLIGAVIDEAGFDPAFEISRTTLDIFGKVPSLPLFRALPRCAWASRCRCRCTSSNFLPRARQWHNRMCCWCGT